MKTLKSLILGALAVAGALCAQAASEAGTKIAAVYTNGSPTPTYIEADGNNDDGSILSDSIGQTSANERIVLLKNVTLGVQSIPMWGNMEHCPAVTFDLNGVERPFATASFLFCRRVAQGGRRGN